MAMFREHIAIGAILSMVVVVAVYFYALITDPWLLLILFAVTTIGSFLPDVDSDSGMPFYLVFGTMTLAATGVVLLYVLSSSYATDWRYLAGIPLAALVFFWAVVGGILKKCTRHRGIFHSLPAMVIAGVATFLIAERFGLSDLTSLVFGAAMAVGFASHLALDELHSFVDLEGIPFIPKKSLGTALKLFSDSNRVNMATYIVLVALVYTAFGNPLQADAFYSLDAESASQLCCEDESAPFQNSAPGGRSYSSKNAMVAAPTARLAFYNDSDVIEIESDAPPAPEDPGLGGGGDGGSSEDQGGGVEVTGGGTGGSSGGSSGGGSSGGGSSAGGGTSGGNGSSAGSGATGGETGTEEEGLLDLLVAAGAVSGSGAASGSSFFEDSSAGGGSGALDVSIDGANVRAALRGKYDLQELLKGWRSGSEARLNARGLGLVAASTALSDKNIDSVSFTGGSFEIKYRSRGYLFSFIPVSFPVRVVIVPEATSGRVIVLLPWYRFFVREFFTGKSLAAEINAVLEAEIGKNAAAGADLKLQLFEATADFLRKKIGTITDTINLGTQPSP